MDTAQRRAVLAQFFALLGGMPPPVELGGRSMSDEWREGFSAALNCAPDLIFAYEWCVHRETDEHRRRQSEIISKIQQSWREYERANTKAARHEGDNASMPELFARYSEPNEEEGGDGQGTKL